MENNSLIKKEYAGIDAFRVAAAILVIAIHTAPLSGVSAIGDILTAGILARIAVPFFFMATGYFLFPFSPKKFFLKNLALYGIAILLFLPLNLYAGHFNQKPFFPELIKDLLFNGTFYHLWYFPAVMMGVGIVILLMKYFRQKTVLLISLLLYIIGVFGDSYYGFSDQIPFIRGFYHRLFQCFDYTRNGLFFAPLYLMLGVWLSGRRPFSRKHCILGLALSTAVMAAEGLLLHLYSKPRHDSMYFSLAICMIFLFQLLLLQRGSGSKNLRRISLFLYLIHPWCIVIIRGFAKLSHTERLLVQNSILFFLLVVLLSVCLSVPASLIWDLRNRFAKKQSGKKTPDQMGRAWAEVNLSNLRYNLNQLRTLLPEGCEVMAVVKADAYGHGAVPVASALLASGVKAFAVATMEEGIRLRKNAVKGDILVLGYTLPEQACLLAKYDLTQTVVDYHHAEALNKCGTKIRIHLKIDTGMHRLGEDCSHLQDILEIFRLTNLTIEGIYTHLCVSDSPSEEDRDYTRQQIRSFYRVVDYLKQNNCCPPLIHIQSSYGILNYPDLNCSRARIGIALYGVLSKEGDAAQIPVDLKPVLSIKARISVIKELEPGQSIGYGRIFTASGPMKIATLTIGYADGIPRNMTHGQVLLNGQPASVVGRICMDQLTIDITQIPDAKQSDVVTIIGDSGDTSITAEQVAQNAGTITNELLSRLGSRLERVYLE